MKASRTDSASLQRGWAALVVELLIVVIGVFLGLQAQQWNQSRLDRVAEREYLARLEGDFAAIGTSLARCSDVYRDSLGAIEEVSEALETHAGKPAHDAGQAASDGKPDDLVPALIRMTAEEIPAGRSATFAELLATGDLGTLRDVELREGLVAYDEAAQIHRDIWRTIRMEVSTYSHAFYGNIDVSVSLEQAQVSSIRRYDLDAMAADPEFRALLNVSAATKGNMFELCRTQGRLAKAVSDRLRNRP
ncbi:MAG: hypothetical protein AAFX85_16920 [Pseudomonadota bacterium]